MNRNLSRTPFAGQMPAGPHSGAWPARAQVAGEIMTVDVNFIEPTGRRVDTTPNDSNIPIPAGDRGAAHGSGEAGGLAGITRYTAAEPDDQLEMELR